MTTTTGIMRSLGADLGAVRVEDVYDTDIDDLWEACTSPERLARWIAEVSGEPRLGETVTATFTSTWSGRLRVEECEEPHHLRLASISEDGTTEIEAWLTTEGDRTRLVVEERGLPLRSLHYYGAGWQAHLEDLDRSLSGRASAWKARWDELTPAYEEMPVN